MQLKLEHSKELEREINKLADPEKAKILARFFKTAPGQYGEGDIFLGIPVPLIRGLVSRYQAMNDNLLEELLKSSYHEVRLLGVLSIVTRYERAKTEELKKKILNFYLKNRFALNNWDLVDLSVYKIWGNYLLDNKDERKGLFKYANSKNLWERRMAIVATMALIKAGEFSEILELSRRLKTDREDLIQKAIGWMLREVGKKDKKTLTDYLDKEATNLPRTTLRYAIERFEAGERRDYLSMRAK